MKRVFGLIGFTLLTALTAVYYFDGSTAVFSVLGICGGVFLVGGLAFIMLRKRGGKCLYNGVTLLTMGLTLCGACLYFILYSAWVYEPVVNNYSEEEITLTGYVCDEVTYADEYSSFDVQTYTVNGEEQSVKIRVYSYYDVGVQPFDKVNMTLTAHKSSSNSLKSKGIFLRTYTSDSITCTAAGEKEEGFYSFAVSLRMKMKSALDSMLPEKYSGMCRAALLGDMRALDDSVYDDFSLTGTSFLIVVSGMHLVIIISFLLFFVRKITFNRFIIFGVSAGSIIVFSALTGFTPSIVRAGIMMLVTTSASASLRRADSLNSLGLAAMLITLQNPFSVGDVGMLLSFAATAGIILWSKPMTEAALEFFGLAENNPRRRGIGSKIMYAVRRGLVYIIGALCVSLSAFLWVLPITVIAFGTVSPLQIFISLIAEPVVNALIIFSMLAAAVYLIPFVSFLAYPFALFAGLCSKLVIWFMNLCAGLPFASILTNDMYYVVWVVLSVLAAIIGYFVKAKHRRFYIKCAAAMSLGVLAVGASITEILLSDSASLQIYGVNGGASIVFTSRQSSSVLSCGGSKYYAYDVVSRLSGLTDRFENVVVPGTQSKYSSMQPDLIESFEIGTIFIYDPDMQKQEIVTEYDSENRQIFGEQSFTLELSHNVTDEVFCVNGVVYQYLSGSDTTVLCAAGRADFEDVPEKYRNPDFLIIDLYPDNAELVTCSGLIFTGADDTFERNKAKLDGMCSNVYSVCKDSAELDFNDNSFIKITDGG